MKIIHCNGSFSSGLRHLLLLSCFILLVSKRGISQRIVAYHPHTFDTIAWTDPLPQNVEFRVVDLEPPAPDPAHPGFADWNFHWDFGDCKAPSLDRAPIHYYEHTPTPSFQAIATLTGIYSDEEDLLILKYPPDNTQFSVAESPGQLYVMEEYEPKEGRNVGIIPVREPSPGNQVTLITPYRSLHSSVTGGSVFIEYPSDIFKPELNLLNGCGYTAYSTSRGVNFETLGFSFPSLEEQEQRTIQVTFSTDAHAPVGVSFPVRVSYLAPPGLIPSGDTLMMTVVESQDPNDKLVKQKRICESERLDYTVRFENIGNKDAEKVFVIDHLDSLMRPTTLRVEQHSFDDAPVDIRYNVKIDDNFNPNAITPPFLPRLKKQVSVLIDSTNLKVAWIFHNIRLEANGGKGFLSYSIGLKNIHQDLFWEPLEERP